MRRGVRLLLAVALVAGGPAALAAFTSPTAASNTIQTAADWLPPSVSATVIAKQTGYLAGSIKQGGTYYVYANVADSGNPPAGISTVRSDVSVVTPGQTNVTLTAGSYSVNGVTYNYRSGLLTATNPLSAGSKNYSISSTDVLSYLNQQTFSTTVDNLPPSASDIQTTGDVDGRAEQGETVVFTFSEQIDPHSILAGWTGASTNVVVYLNDGGCVLNLLLKVCGDDSFEVHSGGSLLATLGPVNLKDPDYLGGGLLGGVSDAVFGATGTPSTMVQSGASIIITLGTRSGSSPDQGGTTTTEWDSATSPYDAAGNAAGGNVRSEQGGSDREF
jgi:hypothetical protein